MRIRKNSQYSQKQLEAMIEELLARKRRTEDRRRELDQALFRLDMQLKTLYAKRTIALNFTLPLEESKT